MNGLYLITLKANNRNNYQPRSCNLSTLRPVDTKPVESLETSDFDKLSPNKYK